MHLYTSSQSSSITNISAILTAEKADNVAVITQQLKAIEVKRKRERSEGGRAGLKREKLGWREAE